MDINKVWLSGVVVTEPVRTSIAGDTPLTYFNIQVNESFNDRNGMKQLKPNLIRIEVLGKNAENVKKRVRCGKRYTVDGYIRIDNYDGQDFFRIRAFAVYPDDSLDFQNYKEGLKQALKLIKSSRDLDTAIDKIEELLL